MKQDEQHWLILDESTILLLGSMAGRFLPAGGKTGFSMEKNGVAKTVFAGKNSFCHINCEVICKIQAYVGQKYF